MSRYRFILCLALVAAMMAGPAAAGDKKDCRGFYPEPKPVKVVNTANVNVLNPLSVAVPEGVAITNAPEVNVANTPGVVVVNDAASPIPVVVQNQDAASPPAGPSEVTVINGADQPLPVRQSSAYYSVFVRGSILGTQASYLATLSWPADKAFLVKTITLWCEARGGCFFPVMSTPAMTANDFTPLCAMEQAGRPKVENLMGGILLQDSGVSCRIDKLDADFATRQFKLLVTGELLPK